MMGVSSPGNSYSFSSLTDFHLDQLEQFGIVNLIALVHEHNDVGHAYLTGKQDVLTGLRPWGRRQRTTTRIAPSI